MSLTLSDLKLGYKNQCTLNLPQLDLIEGGINCIIGPNGCGKSTLLRGLSNLLPPLSGEIRLDGKPISEWNRKALAQKLTVLPQDPQPPSGVSLEQLVMQGRFPHQSLLGSGSEQDQQACDWAMALTATHHLKERIFSQLSGGERQRGWIAMALAQQTEYLLLDEPNTFLDIGHQLEVMKLLRQLNQEQGKTLIIVLHEINHACQFADHLIVLKNGSLICQGTPKTVISADLLQQVFSVKAEIVERSDEAGCFPYCIIT